MSISRPILLLVCLAVGAHAEEISPAIHAAQEAEALRVATVAKITPATIAIFEPSGEGGGSGVIVDPEGFALTNFHVAAPCGPAMKVGLADGRLLDAVLIGLDPAGDLALIKLLAEGPLPTAEWGDSERAQTGDEVLVAGNPFLLSEDFSPSISHGILSGVHRYQYPAGALLEYTDCLQTDAAINPGNSGGPLYDATGRLLGINGRASFEKRGRVNVGVGYAISARQAQLYLTHLRSGRVLDHARLPFMVSSTSWGRPVVMQLADDVAEAPRVEVGDELLELGGREITSANDLQNIVGIYPPGWRLALKYRRRQVLETAEVTLLAAHDPSELLAALETPADDSLEAKTIPAPAAAPPAEWYEARPGFANFAANRRERQRVLANCPQTREGEDWQFTGVTPQGERVEIEITPAGASFLGPQGRYRSRLSDANPTAPPNSGGLLAALALAHEALTTTAAEKIEYIGLLPPDANVEPCEVLRYVHTAGILDIYFATESGDLTGADFTLPTGGATCRIRFTKFPTTWRVVRNGQPYLEVHP